jgi:hypothetical protein
VGELEHEWLAGDDAVATREEVKTYDPTNQEQKVNGERPDTADDRSLTSQGHWTSSADWLPTLCMAGAD